MTTDRRRRLPRRTVGALVVSASLILSVAGCSDAGTDPEVLPPASEAPEATAATNVVADESTVSFTANWSPLTGAGVYLLDVAADPAFGAYVPGYQSRNVGTATSFNVQGVTRVVQLYYRVRAVKGSDTTAPSAVIRVLKSFVSDVNSVLGVCARCHPSEGGGLSVASVATLEKGGTHGPAIVAYSSGSSNLVLKLLSPPPFGSRMPQGGPYLSGAQVQVLRDWIDQGAKDN